MSETKTIENYIHACYPAIWINTFEEQRCLDSLSDIVANDPHLSMKVWSCTNGFVDHIKESFEDTEDFVEEGSEPIQSEEQDSSQFISEDASGTTKTTPQEALEFINEEDVFNRIYVLKNFHHYMDNPYILQLLKDSIKGCVAATNYIVFVSPKTVIPPEVEKEIAVTTFSPLTIGEYGEILDRLTKPQNVKINAEYRSLILKNSLGLTVTEAENVYALAWTKHREFAAEAVKTIQQEKASIIKKTGILEFIPPSNKISDIGGASEFKKWGAIRKEAFSEEAKEFGVQSPKGVLLCGVSGGGKSASARALGNLWELPILRFNIGKVFGSYVGESEANMQTALRTSEAMSPCILWIDEIEKALSGIGNDSSGVTSRVFGELLTWMQEKEQDVFVLATGNNITNLPPELLRKGRFDEIFWFDLPDPNERKEIISIHLEKRGRTALDFDLDSVSLVTDGFVGAELEQVIVDGIALAFFEKSELLTEHLISAADQTIPLSTQRQNEISAMREWANQYARSASAPVTKKPQRRKVESTSRPARRLS
ncbi:AAA family ATPase [Paenibacillus xylanilyticus]|uniref:Uncharacterized AAA domain-containing protein ycf46 n=2 Tax=cellular organisms TaxID=131567 RepID=A0A7Y6BWH4_9BACL|nr:AAA family ATPase [Paenibacillus xylanilyticus]NUU75766.1 AAA family ATPase [Paenibacillus xylanilyticus]